MKKHVRAAIGLVVASAITSPLSAEPKLRLPTAKWNVDFGERHCLASRQYGSVEKPLVLALKPSPLGGIMQVAVAWKSNAGGVVDIPARIRIDERPAIEARLLAFSSKATGLRSARINLPLKAFAPMRGATKVRIFAEGEVNDSFALSNMEPLMVQLDRCLGDLQRYWNIEEGAKALLRSRAEGNLVSYFKDSDYPDMAIRKEESGTVEFALLVDETGKIADCTVTATSNVPILDAQSCAVLTARAKLKPATGADGKPAKDAIASKVTWRVAY